MSLIVFLLRSSWKMVAIAAITGFLSGGSTAGLLAIVGHSLNQPDMTTVGSFIGLAVVALVTSVISQVMLVRLSHQAVFQLRMQLLRQILGSRLSHLEQLGNPRLWATLTEDVQAVSDAMFSLPFLCMDLAIVAGCFIYISLLSWMSLLLVGALIIVVLLSCRNFLKKAEKLLTVAREEEDHLFKYFRTTTEGIKELKLHYHRRQAFLNEEAEPTAKRFRQYNIQGMTLFAVSLSWGKLLFFFAIGFVLFALPKIITLSPEAMSGYVLTFTYLMLPIDTIINCLPLITRANIALRKIETLGLSLRDRAELSIASAPLSKSWQTLALHNVVYPYPQEEDKGFIVGAINLTISPGELIFIVGGNGSGKSTLAKLLTGLYIPESGSILLDNQAITAQNREWYRQHFAVVFADFYLFERFLGSNFVLDYSVLTSCLRLHTLL